MSEKNIKDLSQLSRLLLCFLAVGALLNLASVFWSWYNELRAVGISPQTPRIERSEDLQIALKIFQALFFIVTANFFGKWIYRICWNANQITSVPLRCSPEWAVGYFFVPPFNFWRPYQAILEAYEVLTGGGKFNKCNIIFPVWWVAWIFSLFLGDVVFRLLFRHKAWFVNNSVILNSSVPDIFDIIFYTVSIFFVFLVTKTCVPAMNNIKFTNEEAPVVAIVDPDCIK